MRLFFKKKNLEELKKKSSRGFSYKIALVIVVMMAIAAIVLAVRQRVPVVGYVRIDDTITVRVTVASSEPARERGLSGRRSLAADEGMLFIFDASDTYHFWMKEMRFPIDVVWIMNGAIADITTDLPVPVAGEEFPTFAPKVPIDRVLEVPAGFARAHGLKLGMSVRYVDN